MPCSFAQERFPHLQEKPQREALESLASATCDPLLQRLDDARDGVRLAAAAAVQALLSQRPLLISSSRVESALKQLCLCVDDKNPALADAAAAAVLAASDTSLENIRAVNYKWLAVESRGLACSARVRVEGEE